MAKIAYKNGIKRFPWSEPVTPFYQPQVCSKSLQLENLQRELAERRLGVRNETIERLREAKEWEYERQTGVIGLANPVGPHTIKAVQKIADFVKPTDDSVGAAFASAGRATIGVVQTAVITPFTLLADTGRGWYRTAVYQGGFAPEGAYLNKAGIEHMESIVDSLNEPAPVHDMPGPFMP